MIRKTKVVTSFSGRNRSGINGISLIRHMTDSGGYFTFRAKFKTSPYGSNKCVTCGVSKGWLKGFIKALRCRRDMEIKHYDEINIPELGFIRLDLWMLRCIDGYLDLYPELALIDFNE